MDILFIMDTSRTSPNLFFYYNILFHVAANMKKINEKCGKYSRGLSYARGGDAHGLG